MLVSLFDMRELILRLNPIQQKTDRYKRSEDFHKNCIEEMKRRESSVPYSDGKAQIALINN